jgi:hypothetical protein
VRSLAAGIGLVGQRNLLSLDSVLARLHGGDDDETRETDN